MRKHRAPNGALRRGDGDCVGGVFVGGEKAPSAKRCIKTGHLVCVLTGARRCQKAPSAKRCIKTVSDIGVTVLIRRARKHRAPKGALRLLTLIVIQFVYVPARKHRAPKGALRHYGFSCQGSILFLTESTERQKVHYDKAGGGMTQVKIKVRKHRAPNGALRPREGGSLGTVTAREKAPSAKRCIKTHRSPWSDGRRRAQSESTERKKVH